MKGGQPFEGELPCYPGLSGGRASSRANAPAGYAAGASHADAARRSFHYIFFCFFPYFISLICELLGFGGGKRRQLPRFIILTGCG